MTVVVVVEKLFFPIDIFVIELYYPLSHSHTSFFFLSLSLSLSSFYRFYCPCVFHDNFHFSSSILNTQQQKVTKVSSITILTNNSFYVHDMMKENMRESEFKTKGGIISNSYSHLSCVCCDWFCEKKKKKEKENRVGEEGVNNVPSTDILFLQVGKRRKK